MLRKEQQQWRDTFFATEDDDFKVMAGNEDGSLTLQGSEINLDGSVQIKVQDGSGGSTYRSLNTLPEAVDAVSGACILTVVFDLFRSGLNLHAPFIYSRVSSSAPTHRTRPPWPSC
jgi:hypothetical protein